MVSTGAKHPHRKPFGAGQRGPTIPCNPGLAPTVAGIVALCVHHPGMHDRTTEKDDMSGDVMGLDRTKIVPTVVWLGLFALGFATNLVIPEKSRPALQRTAETFGSESSEGLRTAPARPMSLRK